MEGGVCERGGGDGGREGADVFLAVLWVKGRTRQFWFEACGAGGGREKGAYAAEEMADEDDEGFLGVALGVGVEGLEGVGDAVDVEDGEVGDARDVGC